MPCNPHPHHTAVRPQDPEGGTREVPVRVVRGTLFPGTGSRRQAEGGETRGNAYDILPNLTIYCSSPLPTCALSLTRTSILPTLASLSQAEMVAEELERAQQRIAELEMERSQAAQRQRQALAEQDEGVEMRVKCGMLD